MCQESSGILLTFKSCEHEFFLYCSFIYSGKENKTILFESILHDDKFWTNSVT